MTGARAADEPAVLGWCSTCDGEIRNDGTHDCTCGNIAIRGNVVFSNGWPVSITIGAPGKEGT